MAKMHKLNALQVSKLTDHGRHGDGGGLYLAIDAGGRKRWVFLFRDRRTKKLREMGLGGYADTPRPGRPQEPGTTLAQAREKAAAARAALAEGRDPIASAKATAQTTTIPTFGEMADQFVDAMEGQWRNEKHRAQWRSTLKDHAKSLRGLPVNEITVEHVLSVLKPIWQTVPETAGRLRGRIERVLNAAKAAGHRTGENPAVWRGHLENLLPQRQKLSRGHHAALPWREMPDFIARLRKREGVAALAVEFAILTAARSGEVREAVPGEFDIEAKLWSVPAQRMKAAREHRVPLVPRAVEIIQTVAMLDDQTFVFPGQRRKSPLSDMSLTAVLKRMKADVTVHGFRSSFKDWAIEATAYPNELSEAALAHITGDKTERAYRRGDALDRRRELMEAWANYLDGKTNVVALRKAGGER